MRTITRNRKIRAWLALVVASAGLAVMTGTPASAAVVTIDLCAKAGTITVPGPTTVPIWGFALKPADIAITGDTDGSTTTVTNLSSTAGLVPGLAVSGVGIAPGTTIVSVDTTLLTMELSAPTTAAGTTVALTVSTGCDDSSVVATLPGPVLTVNELDTVTINVTNALPLAPIAPMTHTLSLEIPGADFDAGPTDAALGGTVSRTFTAGRPGTYLYQSGGDAGRQEAMGLYGALIVRPTSVVDVVIPNQAYHPVATAYDIESTLVLSQVDANFNAAPDTFDMNQYLATYWMINGQVYTSTTPTTPITAAAGQKVLLRYVNAGYDNTSMMLLGAHQTVVGRDGFLLNNPFDAVAETVPAGGTEDTIVTVPGDATAPSGNGFPLFNRNLHVTNGTVSSPSYSPGGMLIFINHP